MWTKFVYIGLVFLIFSCCPAIAQYSQNDWAPRDHQIHFGIGPSFMYADNGGVYGKFDFSIDPAFSLAYVKKITPGMKLRASTDFQFLSSGNYTGQEKAIEWGEEGHAYSFSGNAIFLDIMPEFYLYPYARHMERKRFNFFGGLGIGFMHVSREQTVYQGGGDQITEEKKGSFYIPLRGGGFYAPAPNWDLGVEGSILTSFSDQLDGNSGHNRANDIPFPSTIYG
ncbi:hypothetical protein QWY93_12345 [Echinicola jeungdonensis]|uniref:Outer membrane protein beta-barrel domain-containing protein n=1 Tax=Echinicola jeungdonensis TaxID=709343 RepID=A0ABV5J414_9BACT|nr:hypothetical protein [Echinicola jeungdonensis]MDN3670115.1 hypothetical protein [Echinicola jeungdonensis]